MQSISSVSVTFQKVTLCYIWWRSSCLCCTSSNGRRQISRSFLIQGLGLFLVASQTKQFRKQSSEQESSCAKHVCQTVVHYSYDRTWREDLATKQDEVVLVKDFYAFILKLSFAHQSVFSTIHTYFMREGGREEERERYWDYLWTSKGEPMRLSTLSSGNASPAPFISCMAEVRSCFSFRPLCPVCDSDI